MARKAKGKATSFNSHDMMHLRHLARTIGCPGLVVTADHIEAQNEVIARLKEENAGILRELATLREERNANRASVSEPLNTEN